MRTTYANQKAITINRNLPEKGSGKQFLTVYYDNITQASRLLSGEAAFKLYLYLLSNQDKYVDNFSPSNFAKDFGISADRCRKVFSQLEEVGYLIKTSSNEYQFYEVPQVVGTATLPISNERRKTGTGAIVDFDYYYSLFKDRYPAEIIIAQWKQCDLVEEGK